VTFAPQIRAGKIIEAGFSRKAELGYPVAAREQGIQGQATVAAIIGKGGQLIDARIYKSSGSDILDKAALLAARSSTFKEPRLGDIPIVFAYLIDYSWQLE
jgi:TonB family protein